MEVEALAPTNLSWDLSKGPVPSQLQNEVVNHYLLELLQYDNGASNAILRSHVIYHLDRRNALNLWA
ncbi:unnamed protein product [Penicillium viridicatum]